MRTIKTNPLKTSILRLNKKHKNVKHKNKKKKLRLENDEFNKMTDALINNYVDANRATTNGNQANSSSPASKENVEQKPTSPEGKTTSLQNSSKKRRRTIDFVYPKNTSTNNAPKEKRKNVQFTSTKSFVSFRFSKQSSEKPNTNSTNGNKVASTSMSSAATETVKPRLGLTLDEILYGSKQKKQNPLITPTLSSKPVSLTVNGRKESSSDNDHLCERQDQKKLKKEETLNQKPDLSKTKKKSPAKTSITTSIPIENSSTGNIKPTTSPIANENENTQNIPSLTIQDAVRDKHGARPRANSTDGELNLPRRGLCDEGMVLASHKWSPNYPNPQSYLYGKHNGEVGLSESGSKKCQPKGLVNLGNTCFLNATLQCLAYLPTFYQCMETLDLSKRRKLSSNNNNSQKSKFHKKSGGGQDMVGQNMILHLKALLRRLHGQSSNGSKSSAVAPREIVNMMPALGDRGRFRIGRQEDAHEFLVHLLDAMKDGELRAAGINQKKSGWRLALPIPRLDETTVIHRMFGGYFRSQIHCTSCNHRSNTYDPFLDLSLEVQGTNSLSSAVEQFTKWERLDKANKWKCGGCKRYVCARKQLSVFRPSLSLIVHMKRFSFGGGLGGFSHFHYGKHAMRGFGGGGSKITKPIDFPSQLSLPLSDGRKCEYSLTGVILHVGHSANSGHYTAYVKKPRSESWYHMDDNYVQLTSESKVLKSKDAYVLFYCRKEVKLELPPPPPRHSASTEHVDMDTSKKEELKTPHQEQNESNSSIQIKKKNDNNVTDKATLVLDSKKSTKMLETKSKKVETQKDVKESESDSSSSDYASDESGESSSDIEDKVASMPTTSISTKLHEKNLNEESSDDSSYDPTSNASISSSGDESSDSSDTDDEPHSSKENSSTTELSDKNSASHPDSRDGSSLDPTSNAKTSSSDGSSSEESSYDSDERETEKNKPSSRVAESKDSLSDVSSSSSHGESSDESSDSDDGMDPPKNDEKATAPKLNEKASSANENNKSSSPPDEESSESDNTSCSEESDSDESSDSEDQAQPSQSDVNTAESKANGEKLNCNTEQSQLQSNGNNKTAAKKNVLRINSIAGNKIEVAVNNIKQQRKDPWNKKPPGRSDEGAALLGNISVGKWDDDDDDDDNVADDQMEKMVQARQVLSKQMDNKERARKRKMHLNSWDSVLDAGKKKKVKAKNLEGDAKNYSNDPKKNPFHRIQSSMQKMNRGRAKGNIHGDNNYTPAFLRKNMNGKGSNKKKQFNRRRTL